MANEIGFGSKWSKPYNKAQQAPFKSYTSETGVSGINTNYAEALGITNNLEDNLRSQIDYGDQIREYTQPRASNISKWLTGTANVGGDNQKAITNGLNITPSKSRGAFGASNYTNAGLGIASGIAGLSDINNSNLNSDQKRMLGADSAVNSLSTIAGAFGPVGAAVGAGLGLINSIGGSLIGTPREIKDFALNDSVAASGAYSGIAGNAADTKASGDTYAKSGLFGKLFGGKNKIVSATKNSNYNQSRAGEIVDANKTALDVAANSQQMATSNYLNSIGGADRNWYNGSIMYGQAGGILKTGALRNVNTNPNVFERYKRNAQGKIQVDAMDEVLSAPQKAAVWLASGKYQKPSEAFDVENNYIANGVDLVLDPMNIFLFSKASKLGKLQAGVEASKEPVMFRNFNLKHPRNYSEAISKVNKLKGGIAAERTLDVIGGIPAKQTGGILEIFKDGGSLKARAKSVIVSGKLHAHKHSLKDIDALSEAEITLKGIPVITKDAEGGIIQHSEVEVRELVLHHDLTMKLEELRKEGSMEAELKAGKLLARELMRNTKDKTGTLRSIRDSHKILAYV